MLHQQQGQVKLLTDFKFNNTSWNMAASCLRKKYCRGSQPVACKALFWGCLKCQAIVENSVVLKGCYKVILVKASKHDLWKAELVTAFQD